MTGLDAGAAVSARLLAKGIGVHCDQVPVIEQPVEAGDQEQQQTPRKSVTTKLIELAEAHYRVLLAEDGAPFAVELDGPNVALPLRGRDGLRQRLARLYYDTNAAAPSGGALADALAVLEGAAARVDREPVALRLARAGGAIVLDLGRADGSCVTVEPGRWKVTDRSPVLFRRTALTGEIPTPAGGGDVEQLLGELVNASRSAVRLIVGWLVAALIPDMPHPILAVFGEQGTAKTTLMRLLAMLVDPSPAPTRTAPRDLGQWAVTASASWVVAMDNVSTIPEWLSDALCRAVTGDGLTSRALYSDADVSVLTFRRVLAMTSIDAGAMRGDLGDRLLPVELDVIDPAKRRTDAEVTAEFAAAAPRLLGALLDLVADVLACLPDVRPTSLPRMADFARLLHAVDAVTEWDTVTEYTGTAADVAEAVIDSDPFAVAVRGLVPPGRSWTGTASELLDKITPERPPRGWPRSPRAVSGAVRRVTPALRQVGITVEHGRAPGGNRERQVTLTGPATDGSPDTLSRPSRPSRGGSDLHERRDGRGDGSGTVGTMPPQPSHRPSRPARPPDLQELDPGDGRDGRDGRPQLASPAQQSELPMRWRRSGRPA